MNERCVCERDKLYQVDDIGFLNVVVLIYSPPRLPATDAAGRPQQHTAARKYERKISLSVLQVLNLPCIGTATRCNLLIFWIAC